MHYWFWVAVRKHASCIFHATISTIYFHRAHRGKLNARITQYNGITHVTLHYIIDVWRSLGKHEIRANAHETCDSISLISYAGCFGLSPVISAKIHCGCVPQPKIREIFTKTSFLAFKVVQGHRCWYTRKARRQCLLWYAANLCLSATILVLEYSTVAEIARFERGTHNLMPSYGGLLESRGSKVGLSSDPLL